MKRTNTHGNKGVHALQLLLSILFILTSHVVLEARTIPTYFKPFEKLVGKTYRGTFQDFSATKTSFDVARWEWSGTRLAGTPYAKPAIRNTNAPEVNDKGLFGQQSAEE